MLRKSHSVIVLALAAATLATAATTATGARAHDCIRGNELWFNAADGTRLVGHRFGGSRPAAKPTVVLAHQSQSSLCEWLPYARELARKGFFVFAFDFRGHGFSKGSAARWGRLPADVIAAVKTVRGIGAGKVSIVGASMGALATIAAAPSIRPAPAAVVSLSGPAAYNGLDAAPAATRLVVPVLFVATEDDQDGWFARDARALFAAAPAADKTLQILPGDLHGVALLRTAGVKRQVEAFLRAH